MAAAKIRIFYQKYNKIYVLKIIAIGVLIVIPWEKNFFY